ncbi:MAG: DUF1439 domain-containing protein [Gammaproteobacteria bacterium]|nr:DUF1439 domain-containing protein [Gammaproteobacteria bacterium]
MPNRSRSRHSLLATAFALTLGGCATLGSYSLDEGQLEGYLREEIQRFDRAQLQAGSPLSLSVKQLDLAIGPDGRDVVVLDVTGSVGVNALMSRLPVDVVLKVEGAPVYSSRDKAVYIRRLQLLESRIDSPFFRGDFKPVTENVMRVLGQMLETVPVYRLNEADARQQWIGRMPVDVKVGPGKLVFVPAP